MSLEETILSNYRSIAMVGAVLAFIFLMSCAQPAAYSPVPSPAPTQTPASPVAKIDWSADGVILPGEYAGMKSFADYELNWLSDGQYIYIGMKARTTGWVAVAIQPGSRMKNADIMLGFVQGDKTTVYDQFSNVDYGLHPHDTELGGTYDILEFAGKEEGGYTTIELKRKLDTGDKYDNILIKGKNQVLWSYGLNDSTTSKHINRGYGEIDI